MIRKLLITSLKPVKISIVTQRLTHSSNELIETSQNPKIFPSIKNIDDDIAVDDFKPPAVTSPLDDCTEDISHVAPFLKPSFNFAAYVNKSETLQQLIKLGVNLHQLEANPKVPPFLLRLNFDKDIKDYVIFLHDYGLQTDDIARIITRNPFILREDLDNLKVRINYLKFKKFDDSMILRILQGDPMWLSFSTQEIDDKLGFFQKTFNLTGNDVRLLATKRPKLITYRIDRIKLNYFVIKEEMGFDRDQIKQILLDTPILFVKNQNSILKTFEYLHRTMDISLETIVQTPKVLTCRESRIKERHQFLDKLGKVQFNPKKPNFISVLTLVSGNDAEFATETAGSSIQTYNTFLKSF